MLKCGISPLVHGYGCGQAVILQKKVSTRRDLNLGVGAVDLPDCSPERQRGFRLRRGRYMLFSSATRGNCSTASSCPAFGAFLNVTFTCREGG